MRLFPVDSLCAADDGDIGPLRADQGFTGLSVSGRAVAAGDPLGAGLDDRCIRYVFSDASVGRDMHTIAPNAWDTAHFENHPVFLWAHDGESPPLGRVEDLRTEAGRLVGTVRYADRDTYDFADTIYRLTKGGFLNAASTGWIPLEWTAANDRKRPGGLDFKRVELLEISKVPVPALPTALVTARAQGIDTAPLYRWAERILDGGGFSIVSRAELNELRKESRMPSPRSKRADGAGWKCGADRELEIDHSAEWDGAEAETSIFEHAENADGDVVAAKAKRGFLLYDPANATKREGYKEPFAVVRDGKFVAIASGLRAAAQRLPQVEGVGEDAKKEAQAVVDHYKAKTEKEGGQGEERRAKLGALISRAYKRGLDHVAEFAAHLRSMEDLHERAVKEDEKEGADSELNGERRAWLDDGHRLCARWMGEEGQEHIDGTQKDDRWDWRGGPKALVEMIERGVAKQISGLRAGKKFSADTLARMQAAHDHAKAAHEGLKSMLDEAQDENPEDEGDNPGLDFDDIDDGDINEERALRERKAKAAAARAAQAAATE